ncbi:MAG: threonylcarbamoyl-AMP synthase [Bacteroidetes bacterium]|nr:threonylcarbamoyl-AMP synthase [Bacteroidota bacterium]
MLLKIYPDSPAPRHINAVVAVFDKGGLVICPTDTIYGLACGIKHIKAVARIAQIKGIKKEKANFSMIINNLSMLSEFAKPIDNHIFRIMRRNLPGPFTFILEANSNVPKIFQSKKKTIGIRMPDNAIVNSIIEELGSPLITTSIHDEDEIIEYTTDPELIYEKYKNLVDIVIDGGYGDNEASTIVDCTSGKPIILRQGKGALEE